MLPYDGQGRRDAVLLWSVGPLGRIAWLYTTKRSRWCPSFPRYPTSSTRLRVNSCCTFNRYCWTYGVRLFCAVAWICGAATHTPPQPGHRGLPVSVIHGEDR